eukprot:TRINITY_DN81182_c0_g1_i1.p1 TRINITY_DN81182_c0_g1~~TRINITY_DN81182_c0_g1_i1.p1  ORF type:complete len:279 (+),score=30.89 TRINITY_DN81182_c0_g1_i1:109-945(+)
MAFDILAEEESACRFIILSVPLLFAPFLAAFTAVAPVAASAFAMCDDADLGSCVRWAFIVVITLFFAIVSTLQIIFVLCIAVAAIWGILVYVHIFLVIVLACVVLLFALGSPVAAVLGYSVEKVENLHYSRRRDHKHLAANQVVLTLLGNFCISCGIAGAVSCSYFFSHSFLLYMTGDWMLFHKAFFDQFSAPSLPTFPNMSLSICFDFDFLEVWASIFGLRMKLPNVLYLASLQVSVVQLVFKIIAIPVNAAKGRFCDRRSEIESQGNGTTVGKSGV